MRTCAQDIGRSIPTLFQVSPATLNSSFTLSALPQTQHLFLYLYVWKLSCLSFRPPPHPSADPLLLGLFALQGLAQTVSSASPFLILLLD